MRLSLLFLALLAVGLAHAQIDGPDAPDVTFTYEDPTGFHVELSNPIGSNNEGNLYVEVIIPPESTEDPFWRMQGYVMFQFNTPEPPEDLQAAIHDPTVARPVLGLDRDDAVSLVTDSYDPAGADPCASMDWYLANTGLPSEFYAVMDPFTNAPFVAGEQYCFLVLAFAHNPYHMDAECAQPDQMLFSRAGASGPLEVHCVVADPFAGVGENGAITAFQVYPNPATSELRLRFPGAEARALRILDARGAVCATQVVRSEEPVVVDRLASGVYALELSGPGGHAVRRITVQ